MKKTFVMNGRGFIDEAEEEELHDERVYVSGSRVCLPGRAYLIKPESMWADGDGLMVKYVDGSKEYFENYYVLEKGYYYDRTKCCDVLSMRCSVLHKIFYSIEGNMLSVGEVYRDVVFVDGRKIFTGTMRTTRYTYNLSTGRNYVLPERLAGEDSPFFNVTEFRSFSYYIDNERRESDIPSEIVEQILEIMLDYKQKELGFRPTVYRGGFRNSFAFFASINENPASNQVLALLPYFVNRYYFDRYFMKTDNPLLKLCGYLNIPYCKSIRKAYHDNPGCLFMISALMETGRFKKLDNIMRIVAGAFEDGTLGESVIYTVEHFMSILLARDRRYIMKKNGLVAHGPLLRDMTIRPGVKDWSLGMYIGYSAEQGLEKAFCNVSVVERYFEYYKDETKVANALCRKGYAVCDCLIMLKDIEETVLSCRKVLRRKGCPFGKSIKEFRGWLKKMYLSGFDRYTHDSISIALRWLDISLGKSNVIEYDDSQKALAVTVGNYDFRLPKTAKDLIAIGDHLKICVGGYSREAVNKSLNIVSVWAEDVPVACIELSADAKSAKQVKGYRNCLISVFSKLGSAIFQWMKDNHIDCATRDFKGPRFKEMSVTDMDIVAYPEVV